ncbi:hypothetical protein HELRODRAFT_181485 [Helobdella robusta]|uniref:Importin N-terminal domain-containing protein n=1 Tax=Helobdella robusta TaxID=6412 RepID=T1FH19_HELRO|nr:hypothetical protein HELRODRAFT_181485 [Helobdella robusta]ESN92434.1 hypothetical protein HELRODRAFT_181485 [Helobdella robusta]
MASGFNLMLPFTAETVEMAVTLFYQNSNNSSLINEMNPWLTRAQTSMEAWSFCWPLMQLDKRKDIFMIICPNFRHEIPEGHIDQLKSSLKCQLLNLTSNWMRVGVNIGDQRYVPLVELIFNQIHDAAYIKIASEALVNLFKCVANHKYPRTMIYYLERVVGLEELFNKIYGDSDDDLSLAIFVSAGECNLAILVNGFSGHDHIKTICCKLLGLIVRCVAVKGYFPVDEMSSDLTFGFWYNLQDEIMKGIMNSEVKMIFKTIYLDLFQVMCKKVTYPPYKIFESWSEDDKEGFRCYRQDISDAAAYFMPFLEQSMLLVLNGLLEGAISRHESRGEGGGPPWEEFEAIIYMLTSITEGGLMDESCLLNFIFRSLPRIPCTHEVLITQVICAELMDEDVEMFTFSIQFILRGICDHKLSSSATMALKDIFSTNRRHVKLVAREVVLESNKLQIGDQVRLMCILGYVLSDMTTQQSLDIINVIVTPHVITLHQLTSSVTSSSSSHIAAEMQSLTVDKLKMLSGFFSSFASSSSSSSSSSAPSSSVPEDDSINSSNNSNNNNNNNNDNNNNNNNNNNNDDDDQDACDRTLILVMTRELMPLIKQMMQAFVHDESIISIMIIFANDSAHKLVLQSLFTSICNKTLSSINSDPKLQTDIIEAFMSFLSQMVKKNVGLLKGARYDMNGLVGVAILGMAMHEQGTCKSSCTFLGIGGELPRQNLNPLADVLHAFNIKFFDLNCRLLNEVVNQDGFPHSRATRPEKEQFAKIIVTSQKSKRKLKDSITEYSMLWRGIIGTEYAMQTSLTTQTFSS